MHFNKILTLFVVATAATAAPAEDLEARAIPACASARGDFCCARSDPFVFLFIRSIGQNCVPRMSTLNSFTRTV